MSFVNKQQWTRLERWSANIFFISGGLWLLDTVSLVVNRFLGGTEVTILLEGVSFVIALVATAIGILGLYSRLSDQTPRLAVAGVGGIAAAVGGLVLTILLSVVMASDSGLLDGLFVVSIFALLFGFLLFGIASVQAAVPSRVVGLLLLGVAGISGTWVVVNVALGFEPPDWLISTLAAAITVDTLAIGYLLRTAEVPSDRAEPSIDSAT